MAVVNPTAVTIMLIEEAEGPDLFSVFVVDLHFNYITLLLVFQVTLGIVCLVLFVFHHILQVCFSLNVHIRSP